MSLDYTSRSDRSYTFRDFVDDLLPVVIVGGIIAGAAVHALYDTKSAPGPEQPRPSAPSPLEEIK